VFVVLAAAVGVVVGVAAAGLIGALEGLSRVVEWAGDQTGTPELVVLGVVPIGFLAAWWIARRFAPEVAGDGVPAATEALAIRSGYLPTRSAPLKILATALTVGPGGSAGREGPIVQIGSSIGSSIARHTGLGEDRVRSLVAAGAGAAIGASFNAPIAGMLFAMEVILGNFAIRHLNAVVVASVAAAVTTRSIVGEELILRGLPHRVRDPRELLLYASLGILAALVGWLFLRLVDVAERIPGSWRSWMRPVLLGLAVAGLGWAEPRVLGTGQGYTNGLLNLLTTESIVWYTVAGIAGAKMLATALTLGSGGSGGAFMPSLFIGAALGAAFADLVAPVWSVSTLEPGSFAVVGMAATFAAVARAPLTSILIVFEITQDYGLVLPLMLAATLATVLADRVHRESVYTMALARRGIRLSRRSEVDLLDTIQVGSVVNREPVSVEPDVTTATARELMDTHRLHGLPVVEGGSLIGIITITDLIRSGGDESLSVRAVMTPHPVTATPETPVSDVLQRMSSLGVGRIPIVAEDDPDHLVSVFRREDAVRAYHVALEQEVDHDLGTSRLRARVASGADFRDIEVPTGSVADGRALKEIPLPVGTTVVSVRRGLEVLVPDGSTRLRAGDILTMFSQTGVDVETLERFEAGDTSELEALSGGDDRARFFDIEIPQASVADGRPIREVAVPSGCTIVSVRRGNEVIVPDGSTVLEAGDLVTVFARPDSRRSLVERLRARTE
jgi:CIC family chloride channel protein